MKVNAENNELVLQNTNGDTIIIPKDKRTEVLSHLKNNNYSAIDKIASELPYMEDYAEDGTLLPPTDPPEGLPKFDDVGNTDIFDYTDKRFKQSSGAMSQYKMLLESGDMEGADNVELGHYYTGKVPGYSNQSNELRSTRVIKVSDLQDIPEENRKDINDYNFYTGSLNETGTKINTFSEGGYVKAEEGLNIKKRKDKNKSQVSVNYNTLKTNDLEQNLDVAKNIKLTTPVQLEKSEFGDKKIEIPENMYMDKKDVKAMVNKWNTSQAAYHKKSFEDETITTKEERQKKYSGYGLNTPSFEYQKCTGASCKAMDLSTPNTPPYREILKNYGITDVITAGGTGEGGGDGPGLDAWEWPSVITASGAGTSWFSPNKSKESYKNSKEFYADIKKQRNEFAEGFMDLPVGSILSAGESEKIYTKKDSKISYYDIKTKKRKNIVTPNIRTRHSMEMGAIDKESGDRIVYNPGFSGTPGLGNIQYVGYSGNKGTITPEEFMKKSKLMYATSLKDKGDWSPSKLEKIGKHNRNLEGTLTEAGEKRE